MRYMNERWRVNGFAAECVPLEADPCLDDESRRAGGFNEDAGFLCYISGATVHDMSKGWAVPPAHYATFFRSLVGAQAAQHLLAIRDRHSDNIMLQHGATDNEPPRITHIDYGHVLGRTRRREPEEDPLDFLQEFETLVHPQHWARARREWWAASALFSDMYPPERDALHSFLSELVGKWDTKVAFATLAPLCERAADFVGDRANMLATLPGLDAQSFTGRGLSAVGLRIQTQHNLARSVRDRFGR